MGHVNRWGVSFLVVVVLCTGYVVSKAAPKTEDDGKDNAAAAEKSEKKSGKVTADALKKAKLYGSGYEKDNVACLTCHLDFAKEELVVTHFKEAKMTCMNCHGDSDAHRDDESNMTMPDVLWGRAETEPFCGQCHEKEKHPVEEVVEFRRKWQGKQRPNQRWVKEESICTDCHGNHAIPREGEFR